MTSTALFLAAGRFGFAPTVNRPTTAGLKFYSRDGGLQSGDPAGFTATGARARLSVSRPRCAPLLLSFS